jgi:hypothetical protein
VKDKTEQAYDVAAGYCLDAMQSLRRFSGREAIEALRGAIRVIEREQIRAQREDRIKWTNIQPAPLPAKPFEF